MHGKTILIVYGSLAPGEANHHIISHIEGIWYKALIKGKILDNGWATRTGYPEFRRAETDSGHVEVLAFVSEDLHKHWDHIDEFEGTERYKRSTISCELENGKVVDAFIYEAT